MTGQKLLALGDCSLSVQTHSLTIQLGFDLHQFITWELFHRRYRPKILTGKCMLVLLLSFFTLVYE